MANFSPLFGQFARLKGEVKSGGGTAIGHATIKVKGTEIATMSRSDGTFEISKVPYGTQVITISSVEIQTKEFPIIVEKSNRFFHFEVFKKGDLDIEEVNITAKTEKRALETSGFAVAVIETKEASLRNLTTNELLDRSVGVRVRQNGGLGSAVEYNLNGMTGSTVGLFLDGLELSTYGSSFNLNNIPPAMIERIEVYKGVLPSHLSGDYVGGAINVVLKNNVSRSNLTASVSYGSFNTFQTDLSGMFRDQKTGFTVRASGFYTYTDNSYETWGKFSKFYEPNGRVERYYKAKRFNDSYKSVGGRFELGFTDVNWADQFFVGYNGSFTHNEIPHGQTMGRPYVGRFNEYDANVLMLNYRKENFLIEGLSLNFNGIHSSRGTYLQDTVGWQYNWDGNIRLDNNLNPMHRGEGQGQQGEKTITDVSRKITNLRTNLAYNITKNHRVSVNHKFEITDRDDEDLLNPVDDRLKTVTDVSQHILSASYEAITLNERLKTNVFGKYSLLNNKQVRPVIQTIDGEPSIIYNQTKNQDSNVGYGLAVAYTILPQIIFIGSTEQSFVNPTEEQLYGAAEKNIVGNAGLRPEEYLNINAGVRLGRFSFGKHKISLYGSTFWRNGKEKIALEVNENLSENEVEMSQFVNLGKTQSRGFEAEISYTYGNSLNAMVSLSKFNALLKERYNPYGTENRFYNAQIPNEPFFNVNGNVQYRVNNFIQKKSILNLHYNTGYVAPFRTVWPESEWFTTPRQFIHDLGVSYRPPSGKLVVSLDAKNMFNAEVYDNFGVQKPGRAFYLKLNYTISKF
ncbi:MAG: TonB-dependent receptor [Sphingobacterium sp.]